MTWPITNIRFASVLGVGDIVAIEWFGATPRMQTVFVTREVLLDWPSLTAACLEQLGEEEEVVDFFGDEEIDEAANAAWRVSMLDELFRADHRN